MKLNGLEDFFNFKDENGEIVDFSELYQKQYNPLLFAINHNKTLDLNLNSEQFDYLIKKSNLNQLDIWLNNSLMSIFKNYESENLNSIDKQFDYLIKKINLKHVSRSGHSPLILALISNAEQGLNLTKENWKYLINNSDISVITSKEQLLTLKKIQSELLNEELLNKIDKKEDNKKNTKI